MRERNVHFDLGVSDYQIDRLAGRRKAVKKSELEVSTITNHQVFLSPKARRKAQNEIVRLNCAGFTVVLEMGSYSWFFNTFFIYFKATRWTWKH